MQGRAGKLERDEQSAGQGTGCAGADRSSGNRCVCGVFMSMFLCPDCDWQECRTGG